MLTRSFLFASLTNACCLFLHHGDAQPSPQLRKSAHQADSETIRHRTLANYDHSVALPPALEGLTEVYDTEYDTEYDVPVFWHVSKSGGTTMVDIFSTCLKFVVASEVGVLEGHDKDEKLAVVELNEGLRYVNVDTTTSDGIRRAATMGLVPSGMADVIVTPLFFEAVDRLFASSAEKKHRGRAFTVLRHPVHRAASMFYYLQNATWEETYDPTLRNLTVAEYARSGKAESDWMTRFLVNKPESVELGTEDVVLAREILRRKFLVGLLTHMEESITRFERFFGWNLLEHDADMQKCVTSSWTNKHKHPAVEEGSEAWNALVSINRYDMELFLYANELFRQQAAFFSQHSREQEASR